MKGLDPKISFTLENSNDAYEILNFLDICVVGYESAINKLPKTNPNIELFSRLTLVENNDISTINIKKLLAKHRYNYHYIVIEPTTAGLAAFAARDRRVDAVRISPNSKLKIFNTRYGRRLEENNKIVELDISCIFSNNLAKHLRPLLRIVKAISKCKINFILSINPSNPWQLRSYRGLQAFGRIINLTNRQTSPVSLFERLDLNKKKLRGEIPFSGIEVI